MYIITGFGRSGTSFISEIFQNAGYQMGKYRKDVDAGFENHNVCQINAKLGFSAVLNNDLKSQMNIVAKNNKIVKDPRFSITLGSWVEADINIEGIFWCHRDYDEILISSKKSNAGQMQMFRGYADIDVKLIMQALKTAFFNLCTKNNISLYVINFPESLQDFNQVKCLNNIIKDETRLYKLWEQTVR